MTRTAHTIDVAKSILANPRLIAAKPSVNWFLLQYMRKFTIMDVAGRLVLHSHLPPLNSRAFSRFVNEHVLSEHPGPSHAQIGITDACPQNCLYCYNRGRTGVLMDTQTILSLVRDLKSMGVFWIGLTGGEPLLNRDAAKIVEAIGDDCSSKLFTTGSGLTKEIAADLRNAGLFYVTVSLDHWDEETHDRIRGCKGAFRNALQAIEMFRDLGDMHVSVSAVLSGEMLRIENVERFLAFLQRLEIHEAWLSESKPAPQASVGQSRVITDTERSDLIRLQDRYNRHRGMTVNYLAHFEDARHFGCTCGHKMIFIDPFGEVSPCVFVPMSFGNVRTQPVTELYREMGRYFHPADRCFINTNHEIIRDHFHRRTPLDREDTLTVLNEVRFGRLPRFFRLQYR